MFFPFLIFSLFSCNTKFLLLSRCSYSILNRDVTKFNQVFVILKLFLVKNMWPLLFIQVQWFWTTHIVKNYLSTLHMHSTRLWQKSDKTIWENILILISPSYLIKRFDLSQIRLRWVILKTVAIPRLDKVIGYSIYTSNGKDWLIKTLYKKRMEY